MLHGDNYDFLPIFSERECVVFRRLSRVTDRYREVKPLDEAWGGTTLCLREFKGRVLGTPDEIFEALDAGKLMLGQTELRNPETGRTAVIEYPIKTINWHRDQKIWQVDTGPLLLPDLSVPAEEWSATIQLAYIVFNVPEWADFVVEQITPITEGEQEVAQVYHYSGIVHKDCRNVLIAMDEDTR